MHNTAGMQQKPSGLSGPNNSMRAQTPGEVPATASRSPIILAGCSRLERLRYAAEQAILDWRDAAAEHRPQQLLLVRDAQYRVSQAKFRNAHLTLEVSARTWVDDWRPKD